MVSFFTAFSRMTKVKTVTPNNACREKTLLLEGDGKEGQFDKFVQLPNNTASGYGQMKGRFLKKIYGHVKDYIVPLYNACLWGLINVKNL